MKNCRQHFTRWFSIVVLLAVSSCSPYRVKNHSVPDVEIPSVFQIEKGGEYHGFSETDRWWEEYHDKDLNTLVEAALAQNLSLKAAWSRLRRAQAAAVVAGSGQYPQLEVKTGVSRTRTVDKQPAPPFPSGQTFRRYQTDYFVTSGLSFEIDIWQRVASQAEAALLRAEATQADAENTALLLIGSITELWFRAKEQTQLIDLLNQQIEVGKTLLELTELRFAVGRGSALDVYQQRQQLTATRSQLPRTQSALEQTLNQISTLSGLPSGKLPEIKIDSSSVALPPFPTLLAPVDLLQSRPDLRAAQRQLQGAEYDIAAALADRFPRLTLGFSYDFRAQDYADLFTREVGNVAGNLAIPLLDGGRRRAEVRQRQAAAEELSYTFGNAFLTALEDVENSLVAEKYQLQFLTQLRRQVEYARSTLSESKSRYINGLSDYLSVIVSLQALQELERRLVTEESTLLVYRARLYRALGGRWTEELNENGIKSRQIDQGNQDEEKKSNAEMIS